MEAYYVDCKKNATNKNSSARGTKQNRLMLVSKCVLWGKKIKAHLISRSESIFEKTRD